MQLKLFYNKSDNNYLTKDINLVTEISGNLKDNCSIVKPTIVTKLSNTNIANFNYAYISDFKRYYYVTDIVSLHNGLVEISCNCDVLMSFKTGIKSNTAIIERQENNYNMYLNDSEFMTYNYRNLNTKLFPNGFGNSSYYYLTVCGGWSNINGGV